MLRDALVELLEEMDIEKISVNRLAQRATINRVTFYLHYRDIPDMLDKMADDMVEEFKSIMKASETSHVKDKDAEWPLMVSLLEHIAEQSRFYKVILATNRTTVFTDRLLQLLKSLIVVKLEHAEKFVEGTGIKREIAIWYGSSAVIGSIIAWLRMDMPYTPQFLAGQFALLRKYVKERSEGL
ncbi:TetR/AcrR family transcriptional regulator C-terminal domain-containing protein [Cohnella boryungensis]|uniref:TetR/AcrR family transcriptional regulator C-terminal domain-containing protein n=2 Tax=Cohnella boryungensis TaxID=768479 RepID=A0ABV8SK80_9BACL